MMDEMELIAWISWSGEMLESSGDSMYLDCLRYYADLLINKMYL